MTTLGNLTNLPRVGDIQSINISNLYHENCTSGLGKKTINKTALSEEALNKSLSRLADPTSHSLGAYCYRKTKGTMAPSARSSSAGDKTSRTKLVSPPSTARSSTVQPDWKPPVGRTQSWNDQDLRHEYHSRLTSVEKERETGFTESGNHDKK